MSAGAKSARLVLATVGSVTLLWAMARASAVPLPYHDTDSARLRLSFSARPERIEVCRNVSAEEMAKREEHMRQRVECDGRFATYTLRVEADGRAIDEMVVRGAGLRNDRPIYLLREFDLPSGPHRLHVSFRRREKTDDDAAAFAPSQAGGADTGIFAGRAQREATEHARRARAAIPARLEYDTSLVFAPRRVFILTFNPERRALQLVDEAGKR